MKLSIKGPRISVVRSSLKSFIIHLLTFSLSLHSIVSNINSSYKLESLSIEEKKKKNSLLNTIGNLQNRNILEEAI